MGLAYLESLLFAKGAERQRRRKMLSLNQPSRVEVRELYGQSLTAIIYTLNNKIFDKREFINPYSAQVWAESWRLPIKWIGREGTFNL